MTVEVLHADCRDALARMEDEGRLFDAIVTDPPAGISFMGKAWDSDKGGRDEWIAWMQSVAAGCLAVMKPGGHALVWALPRTSHWTATAWENAGWQVRDRVSHLFGTGFPKSVNLGNGRGTALKPAVEDWWLLRKPLSEPTIAANVLAHGTGAINVGACRVGTDAIKVNNYCDGTDCTSFNKTHAGQSYESRMSTGRFPANVIHDNSDEVLQAFAAESARMGMHGAGKARDKIVTTNYAASSYNMIGTVNMRRIGDTGTAARFFQSCPPDAETVRFHYSPKANKLDRAGSKHVTVKPQSLLRYLSRLVCPPGGTILDPFAGSGSLAPAAHAEGFNAVLVEREAEYYADCLRRVAALKHDLLAAD